VSQGVNLAMRLTLYGRADCHLCHEMRAVVDAVRREIGFELEEVDVDRDPALVAAYGEEVPVLLVNGRKAFKYRVTPRDLRVRLALEGS
jgi:glutaredoxin